MTIYLFIWVFICIFHGKENKFMKFNMGFKVLEAESSKVLDVCV